MTFLPCKPSRVLSGLERRGVGVAARMTEHVARFFLHAVVSSYTRWPGGQHRILSSVGWHTRSTHHRTAFTTGAPPWRACRLPGVEEPAGCRSRIKRPQGGLAANSTFLLRNLPL